jgi:GNAT superfamily N-acetyltransferase
MKIRVASLTDLPRVMAIVRATVDGMRVYGNDQWDDCYPDESRFRRDVEAGSLFVAELDLLVIGFITVDQDEPDGYAPLTWQNDGGGSMIIHRFAIAPEAQKGGVASALEHFACDRARRQNISHMKVDTHSSNGGMQAFLIRKGYTFVGEMEFNGKDRPFFCYEKMLNDLTS